LRYEKIKADNPVFGAACLEKFFEEIIVEYQ
jgi:hypothetical protein